MKSFKMTGDSSATICDSKTCFCCMCRCDGHECLQQQVSKLPESLRNQLKHDDLELQSAKESKTYACEATELIPPNDLYRNTTYKRDFCGPRNFIDSFPLERKNLVANLKPEPGLMSRVSVFHNDFNPWSPEEQRLCRAKLHVPDHMLKEEQNGNINGSSNIVSDELRNYYCPPHCVGDQIDSPQKNCLIDHKDQFNFGPPALKKVDNPEESRHPFTKFTNYMLDYKGSKLSPRKSSEPDTCEVKRSLYPMSSDTSYRKSFTCPPEISGRPVKHEGPLHTLTIGDGPMLQQTCSMLDYKDPDVTVHKPVRPPRDVFKLPSCRMETETTTGSSFPRWKDFSNQAINDPKEKAKKQQLASYKPSKEDILRVVTTYQEDFDGLNLALCPSGTAEKYGPKVLQPCYRYAGSDNRHDFFRYNRKDTQPKTNCPH